MAYRHLLGSWYGQVRRMIGRRLASALFGAVGVGPRSPIAADSGGSPGIGVGARGNHYDHWDQARHLWVLVQRHTPTCAALGAVGCLCGDLFNSTVEHDLHVEQLIVAMLAADQRMTQALNTSH